MKTVSLHLAIKLKECGYPQEAEFWYEVPNEHAKEVNYKGGAELRFRENPRKGNWAFDQIAAATFDEVLDELPKSLNIPFNHRIRSN